MEIDVMEKKLEKDVRFLRIYAGVATLFCAIFLLSAFVIQSRKQKFEEIDVERINIVEKDGKLTMVISKRNGNIREALMESSFPEQAADRRE
jgi:hypothetical protein